MDIYIPLPNRPKITEKSGNVGTFVIDKLAPGYGLTLGNAFRRALLNSIPGSAIIAARVSGVDHEFSTIPHVKENVLQILLNLKGVALTIERADDIGESIRGTLKVKGIKSGEKEITAGDLEFPSEVTIANPEHHIATITDVKGKLEMEVEADRGLGYVTVDKRRKEKLTIGTLAIDAIFTPIRTVSYNVENMRVGDRTDFNRLIIQIETDGSITPTTAFEKASAILVEHFKIFMNPQDLEELEAQEAALEAEALHQPKEEDVDPPIEIEEEEVVEGSPKSTPVEEIGVSTRVVTILNEAGFKTAGDIARNTEEELLAVEGMGEASVKEIKRAIGRLGVTLRK